MIRVVNEQFSLRQRIDFIVSSALGKLAKRFASNVIGSEKRKCHTVTERCTRQPALTAEKNVKFLSSQTEAGQFIAVSAMQNEDHREDIKLIS
jgi:hypothetical protein